MTELVPGFYWVETPEHGRGTRIEPAELYEGSGGELCWALLGDDRWCPAIRNGEVVDNGIVVLRPLSIPQDFE